MFEHARERVRAFVNAASTREVIFTRGTTESINLVAQSYARPRLQAGRRDPADRARTSRQHRALAAGGRTDRRRRSRPCPWIAAAWSISTSFAAAPERRTRIVACAHVSNALGTVLPVREITRLAHARGAVVLLDGAQAVPHQRVDLAKLDCDFYAFSAHKMYGPTGIGVLVGRESLLEAMPPWQGGGDMILTVTFEKTTYNELPFKFEAGTPNISGAVGLAAAIDYIDSLGIDNIHAHEQRLLAIATEKLARVPGLTIIGTAPDKASVISFTVDGIHPHDLGTILDAEGVAVRTGHHCAMPVMEFFDVPATARASFACYSRESDIDALVRRARQGARGIRLMDLKDLYREVILDHNKSPRLFGRLEPADCVGRRPQPAVRRPAARHRAARGRSRSATCASKARAARSPSPRPR